MYMDPQKLSQLDPKLREAYQRVMGTSIPQPQAPLPQAQPQPPAPLPESQPVSEPKDAITPEPATLQPPVQATNFTVPAPQAQIIPQKKKKNIMPILIGIAVLVFVAVYTLFWTKIFNFKLPFLP